MRHGFVLGMAACATSTPQVEPDPNPSAAVDPVVFDLENTGDPEREGHTPRGFEGQGGGLFVGDDLNESFPAGDGVQIYLSVDLGGPGDDDLADGAWLVRNAVLAAAVTPEVAGSPFDDLGGLRAEEVVFDTFSSALWDLVPPEGAASCVFADQPDGDYSCDLGPAVQSALDEQRRYVNFRLLFDVAGDSDGVQDMVFFFVGDVNATEAGIFSLTVTAEPG